MQVVHYGIHRLVVASDVADEISRAATEFGSAGQVIAIPVACYLDAKPTSVTMVVGAGVPLLIGQAEATDPQVDPPNTLASWDWIRTHTDDFQNQLE